jgi:hypothetical protein
MEPPESIWSSSNTNAMIPHQHLGKRSNENAKADPRRIVIADSHSNMDHHIAIDDGSTRTPVAKSE